MYIPSVSRQTLNLIALVVFGLVVKTLIACQPIDRPPKLGAYEIGDDHPVYRQNNWLCGRKGLYARIKYNIEIKGREDGFNGE